MTTQTPRHLIALFLGLWIALAAAMLVMPATAMSVQTNVSDDVAFYECDGCPEDEADRSICELMCFNATLLATVAERSTLSPITRARCEPARHLAMPGRLSSPDPAPPKRDFLL